MFIKSILYRFTFLSLLFATPFSYAQNLNTFAEYGANIHIGDNTPLWQVSNQHGFSSIKNNTYVRGGVFYKDTIHTWVLETGVDMAIATGFTSFLLYNKLMLTSVINGSVFGQEIGNLTLPY